MQFVQIECKVSIELVFQSSHTNYTNCTKPVKSRVSEVLETLGKNKNFKIVLYFVTDFRIGDEKLKQSEEYKKYIRSPEWEQKKAERLEIDGHKCAMCGRPESKCRNGLQCHHTNYKKPLGQESVYDDLVSLCPSCHMKIHAYYNRRRTA